MVFHGHDDVLTSTAFTVKPVYFAARGTPYRLLCNVGSDGMKHCTSECMQQFRADSLAVEECKSAVKGSFGGISSGGDSGGGCFPGNSSVLVRGRGKMSMDSVELGDEVLTPQGFEPVLAFLHKTSGVFEFLSIRHNQGEICAHRDHLLRVFDGNASDFVAAADLRVGDCLAALWLDGEQVATEIREISRVSLKGLYCPLTYSGEIFVDGICCSCYSPPTSLLTERISHETCHLALAPLRTLRKFIPSIGTSHETSLHPYCASLLSLFNSLFCVYFTQDFHFHLVR